MPGADPQVLAQLHARCFADTRAWSAGEIAALLARPEVVAVTCPEGFALIRAAAGEAELLTLAVAPEARRRGVGRALLLQAVQAARVRGAQEMFLEVASDNHAALALYAAAGFMQVGRRPGYYRDCHGGGADALVLRCELGDVSPGG
ncbi:GNAT family N-acetyltransferase [Alkalilacustris brevis]|uniref:GNAT family N-acetyltransferase n=1 Tax=Alkalilacustris brevis TaxID=2026338 RepID=UPI000E0CE26A|nr:GNAT family N-acetyltransferase [Alkalilacustris brevis]